MDGEPLDPGVDVGAGVDQPLRRLGKLPDHDRIAVVGMAEPTFRPATASRLDLASLDRLLGQQPGDDVHDARRNL